MDAYGFEWDGPVTYQSASRAAHEAALDELLRNGQAYRCGCSRRELANAPRSSLGRIYPGTCRNGTAASDTALRVRTNSELLVFEDRLQGRQEHRLEPESGDFVVLRKDGLVAYQLAVVVDDQLQGITDVVRGIDLLDSTPRQLWLQHCLGYAPPTYAHLPVATNARDQKLSKSHGAMGIPLERPNCTLFAALDTLLQSPPMALQEAPVQELWHWAADAWDSSKLAGCKALPVAENLYQTSNNQDH